MPKHLNSEKKFENNFFKLKIGTTNKNNPLVVYFEGRCFISPSEKRDTYKGDINGIRQTLRRSLNKNLRETDLFDNDFILDFKIAESGVLFKKKSFMSFQFFLRQNQTKLLKLPTLQESSNNFINNIVNDVQNSIFEHDFSITKTKK